MSNSELGHEAACHPFSCRASASAWSAGVTHFVGPVDNGFGATDKSRVAESVTAVILSFAIGDKVAIHRQQVRSWNHPTNRLWG